MIALEELREARRRPAKGGTKRLAAALAQAREELRLVYELGGTLAEPPLEAEAAAILERIVATISGLRADMALYRAKRQQAGQVVFGAQLDRELAERLSLTSALRKALSRNELKLAYQPKVDPASRQIVGVEALCRWDHPQQGPIKPELFIALAEASGLVEQLTYRVVAEVCRDKRRWLARGLDPVVAINLSMRTLTNPNLSEELADIVHQHEVNPSGIMFEITESTVMAEAAHELGLYHLRAMGFRLAVDDFGTGYSFLSYLRRLPVDEIKIDQSFIQAMFDGDNDDAIVHSIVELGHSLGLTVVAEGVEDAPTLQRLTALGCDAVQGFHTGRPVTAEGLTELLSAERLAASA